MIRTFFYKEIKISQFWLILLWCHKTIDRLIDFPLRYVRRWGLWRHFANFFPIKVVKTSELDPKKSYLIGSHPHGILSFGSFCTFGTDALDIKNIFPGLTTTLVTLPLNFHLPGTREIVAGSGICSSTKKSMETLLR